MIPYMKHTTIAYLAGLVDGEGYIGIKRTKRKDCVSPIYHERIQVRMVDEGAIQFLKENLGGNYYHEQARSSLGRPLFCWQASDALASRILKTLLPYLIVKRESAITVLELRKSKNDPMSRVRGSPAKRVMKPEILAMRDSLYVRAKALNHAAA
jgi:hypothetical protein